MSLITEVKNNRLADFLGLTFLEQKHMGIRGGLGHCMLFIALCFTTSGACAGEPRYEYDVPAAKASISLSLLAQQSNTPLLYLNDDIRETETNRVRGTYTVKEALEILLEDTGIVGSINQSGVLTVTVAEPEENMGNEMKNND